MKLPKVFDRKNSATKRFVKAIEILKEQIWIDVRRRREESKRKLLGDIHIAGRFEVWNDFAKTVGDDVAREFQTMIVPLHIPFTQQTRNLIEQEIDSVFVSIEEEAKQSMRAVAAGLGYGDHKITAWDSRLESGIRDEKQRCSDQLKSTIKQANLSVEVQRAERRKNSLRYWLGKIVDYGLKGLGTFKIGEWLWSVIQNWMKSSP